MEYLLRNKDMIREVFLLKKCQKILKDHVLQNMKKYQGASKASTMVIIRIRRVTKKISFKISFWFLNCRLKDYTEDQHLPVFKITIRPKEKLQKRNLWHGRTSMIPLSERYTTFLQNLKLILLSEKTNAKSLQYRAWWQLEKDVWLWKIINLRFQSTQSKEKPLLTTIPDANKSNLPRIDRVQLPT